MGRIDLIGDRYGRLTVIKEADPAGYTRRWFCRCECGNELIVRMPNLRNGHTQSCGCFQAEQTSESNVDNLTGLVFNRLIVLRRSESKLYKSRHAFWECQCECGRTTIVNGVRLKEGTTKSCGCLKIEKGAELQEYIENNLRVDGVLTPLFKSKIRSDNKTGVKGVSERRRKDGSVSYQASIRVKGKTYYLGDHLTIEAAAKARKAGEEKYHKPYLEEETPK